MGQEWKEIRSAFHKHYSGFYVLSRIKGRINVHGNLNLYGGARIEKKWTNSLVKIRRYHSSKGIRDSY